jgi:hypothetical protein
VAFDLGFRLSETCDRDFRNCPGPLQLKSLSPRGPAFWHIESLPSQRPLPAGAVSHLRAERCLTGNSSLLWRFVRIINEDVTPLQFPHEVVGRVVFDHGEVADNLGTPTARTGVGRFHVNADEALILGHCAEQVEELDLQFFKGAFAHGGQKARRSPPRKLRG